MKISYQLLTVAEDSDYLSITNHATPEDRAAYLNRKDELHRDHFGLGLAIEEVQNVYIVDSVEYDTLQELEESFEDGHGH